MRSFFLGMLVGAVATVALGVGALVGIGHALAVSDPLRKADVIVAISGDTGPRAETAVALWKQGYAPLLLFSGASLDPASVSSAEIMEREAMRLGVPQRAILIEPASATTEENAQRVAELMTREHLRTAILVTSPYHQRRASVLFARTFGPADLEFSNHPAEDPSWDPTTWWLHDGSRRLALLEIVKLGAVVLIR